MASALKGDGGGHQRRRWPTTGSSRPIRPCSTKRSTPQAVTGFETEAA
jgi:hypothetical protein